MNGPRRGRNPTRVASESQRTTPPHVDPLKSRLSPPPSKPSFFSLLRSAVPRLRRRIRGSDLGFTAAHQAPPARSATPPPRFRWSPPPRSPTLTSVCLACFRAAPRRSGEVALSERVWADLVVLPLDLRRFGGKFSAFSGSGFRASFAGGSTSFCLCLMRGFQLDRLLC